MAGVTVCEVGPRDGLQNEDVVLSAADRAAFVTRLIGAGFRRIEAVSFVDPRRVPAMADAEEVLATVEGRERTELTGLALNVRGGQRALDAGVDRINFALFATEAFNERNQGVGSDESVRHFEEVAGLATDVGVPCTATVGVAFGCPYAGRVAAGDVARLAGRLAAAGADEVVLADTIGVAVPRRILEVIGAVRDAAEPVRLGLHLHDTRNTAIANAMAALEAGIDLFDASTGGAGGCPFAPKATGNVPSEDLLYALHESGVDTGVDVDAVIEVAAWLEERLGHALPGRVKNAGAHPLEERTDAG